MPSVEWYTLAVASFASLGTFLYGYDTGIVTTTIAHQSWVDYMNHPNTALVGAVGSIYIAGEALGAFSQILIADALGRLRFMQFACIVVTIGATLQTASVNFGMFLAGRIISGFAVGALSGTVPLYLVEISPPKNRGLIGGLSGVGLSMGTMVSNWVGFACGYASFGPVQWRLPLALQLPWGIIMFIGLATFMPNSPRELIYKNKIDDARRTFATIRPDLQPHELPQEFSLMHAQIEYEREREIKSYREIFRLYRHRVLVAVSVQVLTALTGVNVIQYYQTILYEDLGIDATSRLALSAVWGTCAFLSNAICISFLPDRIGRRRILMLGLSLIIVTEIYAAIMQLKFQNSPSRVGKGFAVAGIFFFVVCYYGTINSTTWLYGSEVLPISVRSRVMGLSATAHYAVNVGITEAGPTAFARIGQNYYYVFVACCVVYIFLVYFYYPETNQKTLEQIAAAFGDRVVDVDKPYVETEGAAFHKRDDAADADSTEKP
ncbi:MFS monosaccharide transporter [Mycena sanguinolenta]|uniref:MFS monosaccharide transporter n=1 Tax=Mycena sanguinolenta TaxID=230812 RepID=A0A8H6YE80_9AGAR|nr:MFS monosaccharide transporter [Mycena sanguinolenta]